MEREHWERVGGGRAVGGKRLKGRMKESKMGGNIGKSEQKQREQGEGDKGSEGRWGGNKLKREK